MSDLPRSASSGNAAAHPLHDDDSGSDDELAQTRASPSPSPSSSVPEQGESPLATAAAAADPEPAAQPSADSTPKDAVSDESKRLAAQLLKLPMLKCGWLDKRDALKLNSFKPHWCVLRGHLFAWHKDADSARIGAVLGSIDLSSAQIVSVVAAAGGESDPNHKLSARSFGLQQAAGEGLLALRAREVKDRDAWLQVLETAKAKVAAAAAESSAATADAKGKKKVKKEKLASRFLHDELCFGCHKNFTTLRRRHHCRRCCHTFCAACSEHKSKIPALGITEQKVRVCDDCYKELLLQASTPSASPTPASGDALASPGTQPSPPPAQTASERAAADALAARERDREAEEQAAAAALAKHRAFLAKEGLDHEHAAANSDEDDGGAVAPLPTAAPISRVGDGRSETVVSRTRATRPPPKEQPYAHAAQVPTPAAGQSTPAQPAAATQSSRPPHTFTPYSQQSQSHLQQRGPMGKMHISEPPNRKNSGRSGSGGGDVGDAYVSLSDFERMRAHSPSASQRGARGRTGSSDSDTDDDGSFDGQRRRKQPWYCCC